MKLSPTDANALDKGPIATKKQPAWATTLAMRLQTIALHCHFHDPSEIEFSAWALGTVSHSQVLTGSIATYL